MNHDVIHCVCKKKYNIFNVANVIVMVFNNMIIPPHRFNNIIN